MINELRPKYYRLNEQGEPVPCIDDDPYLDLDNHIVVQDECGPVQVSTIFLSLDHNFTGEGPPLLFETMILFRTPEERIIERAPSRSEALAIHTRWLNQVKELVGAVDSSSEEVNARIDMFLTERRTKEQTWLSYFYRKMGRDVLHQNEHSELHEKEET